jgi:hypothetical protein
MNKITSALMSIALMLTLTIGAFAAGDCCSGGACCKGQICCKNTK